MNKEETLARLEAVENLPTLPAIVHQVQALLASPRSNMAQIATVVSRDQAIAGRVIRLVNSAFYGSHARISSIQQAIVILGLTTVKNMVLGVSVVKTFAAAGPASLFDRELFWLHSFGVAQAAKRIAAHLRRGELEDYFIAGLLHDIGILAEEQFLHAEFVEALKRIVNDSADLAGAERDVLGLSHEEIGFFLAQKWRLPGFIAHSIRNHHRMLAGGGDPAENPDILTVVHIADAAIWAQGMGRFCARYGNGRAPGILKNLGIEEDVVDEIAESVAGEAKALMREWGM